jgi:hypothetical protein
MSGSRNDVVRFKTKTCTVSTARLHTAYTIVCPRIQIRGVKILMSSRPRQSVPMFLRNWSTGTIPLVSHLPILLVSSRNAHAQVLRRPTILYARTSRSPSFCSRSLFETELQYTCRSSKLWFAKFRRSSRLPLDKEWSVLCTCATERALLSIAWCSQTGLYRQNVMRPSWDNAG